MLKIGICDDDPTFVDDIEKNIEQTIKKHHWKCIIVKFTDGRKLIIINETKDIVNIDITGIINNTNHSFHFREYVLSFFVLFIINRVK